MRISYIGHACFVVRANNGATAILDPFQPEAFGGRMKLAPYVGPVDAVISSHSHLDHRHIDPSFGAPQLFEGPGQFKGVWIDCVEIPHGAPEGRDHGMVRAFCIVVDGIRIVHLGDAGRLLDHDEMERLGRPDLLLVPVGGRFTLGPAQAAQLVSIWQPRYVVPMHYADCLVEISLEPVGAFTGLFDGVVTLGHSFEFSAVDRTQPPVIVVMKRMGCDQA